MGAPRYLIPLGLLLLGLFILSVAAHDRSLVQAFNAAIAKTKAEGTFSSRRPLAVAAGLYYPGDCFADTTVFSFPERTAGSKLDEVLKRGKIIIADVRSAESPSSREDAAFRNYLISLIASNYGVSLSVEVSLFDNSPAVFQALYDGRVDITGINYSPGGAWKGVPRIYTFQPTCFVSIGQLNWMVLSSKSYKSFDDLKSVQGLKVSVQGAGTFGLIKSLLPNANVVQVDDTVTTAGLVELVRNGAADVMPGLTLADLDAESIDKSGLRVFQGGSDSSSAAFGNIIEDDAPASSNTEINFVFAGMIPENY